MRTRSSLFTLLILLSLPATSRAQAEARSAPERLEVFADVSFAEFDNGVRKAQWAGDIGAGLAVRPFGGAARRLSLELRTAHLSHHDVQTGKPDYNHLDAWLVGGDAAVTFRREAATQPYVLGGIGFIKASASDFCSTCQWNVDAGGNRIYRDVGESEHGTDPALLIGAGFKTTVTRHLSIRAEFLTAHAFGATYQAGFLDGTVNQFSGPWGWERFSIGAGFRF